MNAPVRFSSRNYVEMARSCGNMFNRTMYICATFFPISLSDISFEKKLDEHAPPAAAAARRASAAVAAGW